MSQNDWAIIMLFGPVTNYLLAPKKIAGWPSFQSLSNTFWGYYLFQEITQEQRNIMMKQSNVILTMLNCIVIEQHVIQN